MTQNRAIIDKLLTNVSNKYVPQNYISERILPTINVIQTSGKLAGYNNDHLRVGSYLHSGSGKYAEVKIDNRNQQGYSLEKHALSTIVSEEDFANVEQPYEAESDATEHVTSLLWTEKELGLSTTLGDDSIYSASNKVTLSGTDQYNDLSGSTPLEDSIVARQAIAAATGTRPNIAITSREVFEYMRINPSILGSLGYKDNRPGGLEMAELARALGVDEIVIGEAMYNNAVEGQADNFAPIWGKNVIYAVAPKTAAKNQISLGYRIQKTNPRRVFKNALDNPPGSKEILIDDWYQQLIANIDAAYLIKDAIA